MKKKNVLLVLIFGLLQASLLPCFVIAQPMFSSNSSGHAVPAPLAVGDTLSILRSPVGGDSLASKLSQYKGKLIIFDFWNIWCSTCIKQMPEMESLQAKFAGKIQIILVTSNTAAQVAKLANHNKLLQQVKLPTITDDTMLCKYFPMTTFPTHVWIDSAGAVCQITNGYNTTAASIESWLKGNAKQLVIKKELTDFDNTVPLWLEGNGRQTARIKYYSLIGSRVDYRLHTGYSRNDSATGKLVWLHLVNYSIYDMYRNAFCAEYGVPLYYFDLRCILKSKHIERIKEPVDIVNEDAWSTENAWCYEISLPPEKSNRIFRIMRQDIDRYFNLKSRIEFQKRKCLVLKRIKSFDVKDGTHNKLGPSVGENIPAIILNNQLIRTTLIPELQFLFKDQVVLDKTCNKTGVTMAIPALKDLHIVGKALKFYGFELTETLCSIPVLIITDQ